MVYKTENGRRNKLDIYFNEIRKTKFFTREEEIELVEFMKAGDEHSGEKLIRSQLRWVVEIAKSYKNYGLPLEDLIQEGNIGLLKALKKYDETRGIRFITYCRDAIRHNIEHSLPRQLGVTTIPLHRVVTLSRIKRLEENGQTELAEDYKKYFRSGKKYNHFKNLFSTPLLLNAPIKLDGEEIPKKILDTLPTTSGSVEEISLSNSILGELNRVIRRNNLTDREIDVLTKRFNLDRQGEYTLEEISLQYNLTRERMRQIEAEAIKKLRRDRKINRLRPVEFR